MVNNRGVLDRRNYATSLQPSKNHLIVPGEDQHYSSQSQDDDEKSAASPKKKRKFKVMKKSDHHKVEGSTDSPAERSQRIARLNIQALNDDREYHDFNDNASKLATDRANDSHDFNDSSPTRKPLKKILRPKKKAKQPTYE